MTRHRSPLAAQGPRARRRRRRDGQRTPAAAYERKSALARGARHALRHDALHRLQGLRLRLPAGQQSRARARRRRPPPRSRRPRRTHQERHQALQGRGDRRSYFKAQCMHCVDPACAAACMLGSLHKDEVTGVVGWNPAYCVGCRYCQMACPFDVAKFEFDKALPKIVKCELCRHRVEGAKLEQGADGFTRYPAGPRPGLLRGLPARRGDLRQARRAARGSQDSASPTAPASTTRTGSTARPTAGGTQVLYLSHVPFDKLGLPDYRRRRQFPRPPTRSRRPSTRASSPRSRSTACSPAVMLRNRKKDGDRRQGGRAHERAIRSSTSRSAALLQPLHPAVLVLLALVGAAMVIYRFAYGLARGRQPQQRLSLGHLDRLRRRRRHRARLRRLRRRAARLRAQQGAVPPAGPAGGPDQPARLRPRRPSASWSTSAALGAVEGADLSSGAGRARRSSRSRSASWPTSSCC